MKKVLMVVDGAHFSTAAFDFARRIDEMGPVLLTGIFLPSIDYTDLMIYYTGGMAGPLYIPTLDTDAETIEKNIERFKLLCRKHNIEHRVHNKINGSIIEVMKIETRYTDLLILSDELFFSNLGKGMQSEYVHDTLHNAECPVVLLPEKYHFPENIILAYDGTASSVFAIKQFAYLFPELMMLKTTLVYASEKNDDLPDMDHIREFATGHFPRIVFSKLDLDSKAGFSSWITGVQAPLLVSGSFGRSAISEFLRKSFISEIIREHKIPVFVAHN